MASPAAGRPVPAAPTRDEPREPNHPEPACQEAQKWIEAVTGKSFGEKDFRSALENGILLCELLSVIKPGLVKKINRLPTPIAGLDNLSVFLRGCEELGLKGSQLFDPGDLQDTSIRANLKDSDCNRKLKNVLNTVFWLGKAASGCASYSGPTLNLKEFEGLLAQMRMESEEGGDSPQKRSVRDSGYDCWDSERSESLSPPQHTRDNSLDSLDSFGSRSQHSPSPDVVNRGNSDGRGSDSEADGSNRKPDVRKDDMLARRTASSDSRSSIPFNQFLPNRTNASSYIPAPRRKPHAEEGEQRSQVDGADLSQTTPPSADLPPWTLVLAQTPAELDAHLAQYEGRTEEEDEDDEQERIPDLQKDDMMARRTGVFHKQSTATVSYNRFLPLPATKRCTQGEDTADAAPRNKKQVQTDRNKKLNARVEQEEQPRVQTETLLPNLMATSRSKQEYDDDEDEYDENEPVPDLEKDDMMARRTGLFQKPVAPRTNQSFSQFLPVPGSVKYNVSPVSAMKQLRSKPKHAEKMPSESIVAIAAELQVPPPTTPTIPKCAKLRERQEVEEEDIKQEGDITAPITSVTDVTEPISSPSLTLPPPPPPPAAPAAPAASHISKVEAELRKMSVEEKTEEREEKPFWQDDDDLPPMMVSRRVAFMSEDTESVSMSDILNEEEAEHLPPLSQSRHDRMQEQYNQFQEEDDPWRNDLARWKTRRRSASQDLIKKEEERKRVERRMKEQESDSNKRKSIKTYKEIVEEKERREAELCEAYRNAATPEEAAMVLQRYALRFTISDATLDSLKLPRSTSKPISELNQVDEEHKPSSPVNDAESQPAHKPEPTEPRVTEIEETETSSVTEQQLSVSVSTSSPPSKSLLTTFTNSESAPRQSLELHEPQSKSTESPATHQEQPTTGDTQPQTKHTPPQIAHVQPHIEQPAHTFPSVPSVPSRPLPLLVAKPYRQPRSTTSGHKPVKMDGLVRVNGDATEDLSAPITPASPQPSPQGSEDTTPKLVEEEVPPKETVKNQETTEQPPPRPPMPLQTEKPTTATGSAISSLIGGRNCIITTTIVTELTQTLVEPLQQEQSNEQVSGTTGLFGSPVQENREEPVSSPTSMQEYSPTVTEGLEESSVSEQYQREQEKLKKEWEKAQLEVEEEERKHNEEERRILEETVTPLNPTSLLNQQLVKTETTSSAPEEINMEKKNVPPQQNGQRVSTGPEDQHVSKLHFFQDTVSDDEPSKKQELWKTASLDRNPQLNQPHAVKRSGSHDIVAGKQQSSSASSSSPSPQPPSPSRCVSGKRLCSGCSQPLGKGAAMIIDTLGLFFHIQCFKCGVCNGQLGDATAGTDVRIRNGLLSCHECYMATRGRGQPTTL
ncbi:LIM and calponin-likey domains-containing 1-like isoform X2 [Solea senegalensis]|uniref:LIM and calponin-likey domains-containing 1-like isoform X2 n=1 Tax=Solea senegalensis TaxID=28829 RepID=A0AAV6Q9D0_SOLSE|nr:LIM and calponin-likey domains-containing 1-like isoform X2 [Solea senegalensis]